MDSRILYPTPDDFTDELERHRPALFNYVCLSGRQLMFDYIRGKYTVFTTGWFPSFAKVPDTYSVERYHQVFADRSFDSGFLYFRRCLRELAQKYFSSDMELF